MLLPSRNFIDNFFNDPFFERPFEHAASQIMKTDIHENDNSYLVEMELPGYKKEVSLRHEESDRTFRLHPSVLFVRCGA